MTHIMSHVGLAVTDLDRSKRFYVEVLGFEYVREFSGSGEARSRFLGIDPPVSVLTVFLRLGNFQLELLYYEPHARAAAGARGMHETGLTHLAIAVDNPQEIARKALEYGCTIASDLGERAQLLRDPDGQYVELLTLDYLRRAEAG
jgi:catechol 2,3-dioxygenase-like lactoylglutathione lyase family enzyme